MVSILILGILLFQSMPLQSMLQPNKESFATQALALPLSQTDNVTSQDALEYKKEAFKKIEKAEYEQALEILMKGLRKFPQNFTLQSYFATLLGDLSEKFASPLKEKMIQRSKTIFTKLLKESENQPKRPQYSFKNEYYYRFAMYEQQYENGAKMVADYWGTPDWKDQNGFDGYYYQGAGATYQAKKLISEGKKSSALVQAQKALVAWAQYFSYENDYYNAYVHYGLALGMLGYKQEMTRALEHGAQLINKDLNYFEFKDVIDFIENLQKAKS